jgi:hypothetical protein
MAGRFLVSRGFTLALAVFCTFAAMATPAEAGVSRRIGERVGSLRQRLRNGGVSVRFNYTPPRVPVSVNCDPQRNLYITISPRISTPLGGLGVSGTRRVRSRRCG